MPAGVFFSMGLAHKNKNHISSSEQRNYQLTHSLFEYCLSINKLKEESSELESSTSFRANEKNIVVASAYSVYVLILVLCWK